MIFKSKCKQLYYLSYDDLHDFITILQLLILQLAFQFLCFGNLPHSLVEVVLIY